MIFFAGTNYVEVVELGLGYRLEQVKEMSELNLIGVEINIPEEEY